jgi:hypothetical protein
MRLEEEGIIKSLPRFAMKEMFVLKEKKQKIGT